MSKLPMRLSKTHLIAGGAAVVIAFAAGIALGSADPVRRLNLPDARDLPFSHAVVAGGTIYVAGTLGLDPETRKPPADPRAEARLALARPQMLVLARDSARERSLADMSLSHPLLRRLAQEAAVVELPGRYWSCGGPELIEALQRLRGPPAGETP